MPIHFDIKKDLRYQQGVAEGMTKGKKEGRIEGELTTALRIAGALLNDGYNIAEVNKHTGIELSVLQQLLNTRD